MHERLAPVAVFVYNRPSHAMKTLLALENAIGAEKTDVFVFSDGEKGKADQKLVNETRNCIKNFAKNHKFNSFQLVERERNVGLADSIINGVSDVINRYGRIIVMEDDLIAQKGLLVFLNDALSYYQKNRKIWSISGFTIELDALRGYTEDVYFGYRGSSYAWATWDNRWKLCDWKVEDYNRFKYNPIKRAKFNRGGADMAGMLDGQMVGLVNSWAIRWNYSQYKRNMLTVFPVKSFVECIGYDGSGVHCGDVGETFKQTLWKKVNGFQFIEPVLNPVIIREFRCYFSGNSLFAVNGMIRTIMLLLFHKVIFRDKGGICIRNLEDMRKK